ncbi:MAG: carboxypeptidase regulatory-like domain-containing protein, partial [Acidobacteria bacterium]|nr:carboxypeptidase regulatory-like domain-containing protein [Acidobacteriota bacterium]
MSKGREVSQKLPRVLMVLTVILAAPCLLLAQATSTIQGHVSDPTAASVPGATVTATNDLTGVSRSAVTAEDGYYRIPDLLPG